LDLCFQNSDKKKNCARRAPSLKHPLQQGRQAKIHSDQNLKLGQSFGPTFIDYTRPNTSRQNIVGCEDFVMALYETGGPALVII